MYVQVEYPMHTEAKDYVCSIMIHWTWSYARGQETPIIPSLCTNTHKEVKAHVSAITRFLYGYANMNSDSQYGWRFLFQLNENATHRCTYLIEILVHTWWNYLWRIRRCRLVARGVSLGLGFQVSNAQTIPNKPLPSPSSSFFLPVACGSGGKS